MRQELKVIGFSDDQVIFENEAKDVIYWPKSKLPAIPEIGQKMIFAINPPTVNSPNDIINELLKIKK